MTDLVDVGTSFDDALEMLPKDTSQVIIEKLVDAFRNVRRLASSKKVNKISEAEPDLSVVAELQKQIETLHNKLHKKTVEATILKKKLERAETLSTGSTKTRGIKLTVRSECPICLDPIDSVNFKSKCCKQMFCDSCFRTSITESVNTSCPFCREMAHGYDISRYQ